MSEKLQPEPPEIIPYTNPLYTTIIFFGQSLQQPPKLLAKNGYCAYYCLVKGIARLRNHQTD